MGNNKIIGYHITTELNKDSILKNGLYINTPNDMLSDYKAIYLFTSLENMEDALVNWLGDRISEYEDRNKSQYNEICIKVDITDLDYIVENYEYIVFSNIPSNRILNIKKMYI